MPVLSVIVPVYGVEAYLQRCVRSILAQTFEDFELLLVVDGSPDKSAQVADSLIVWDKRILVVHKRNGGVGSARNRGLAMAGGTYVGFVDPDDWVEPETFGKVITRMQQTNADIGVCGYKSCNSDGVVSEYELELPSVIDRVAFSRELFARPRSVLGSVCNKVFRRDYIGTLFDEQTRFCEDGLFLCWCAHQMRTCCIVPEALYVIYLSPGSATRAEVGRVALGLPVRRRMVDVISPVGVTARRAAQADFLDNCMICLGMNGAAHFYRRLAREEFVNYMFTHLAEVLNNSEIRLALRALYLLRAFKLSFCNVRESVWSTVISGKGHDASTES